MAATVSTGTSQGTFVALELKSSPLPGIQDALSQIRTKGLRSLMREVGEYWHREIMPKHFRPGNYQRYNMEPRQPSYLAGKKRRYGIGVGKYALGIFRGETLRRVTYEYKVTVQPHTNAAVIRMNVPTYFSNPPSRGEHPDQPSELLQVNSDDLAELHTFAYERLYDLAGVALSKVRSRVA